MYINNKDLKTKLKQRDLVFAGWVSFAHPSITETFAYANFDFIAIDMEHSTISLEQAQRIIAASQAHGVPCLPRPVSHSNDWTKPLLDSGANGMIYPMVNNKEQLEEIINNFKYAPLGKRSFGVNRAQNYGFSFDNYVKTWNQDSVLVIQIESIEAVNNIESILDTGAGFVDAVMIGPYDISGSLGVPGQIEHPDVISASEKVIQACEKFNISCGTQVANANNKSVQRLIDMGYNYVILSSDLFVLWNWTNDMNELMSGFKS